MGFFQQSQGSRYESGWIGPNPLAGAPPPTTTLIGRCKCCALSNCTCLYFCERIVPCTIEIRIDDEHYTLKQIVSGPGAGGGWIREKQITYRGHDYTSITLTPNSDDATPFVPLGDGNLKVVMDDGAGNTITWRTSPPISDQLTYDCGQHYDLAYDSYIGDAPSDPPGSVSVFPTNERECLECCGVCTDSTPRDYLLDLDGSQFDLFTTHEAPYCTWRRVFERRVVGSADCYADTLTLALTSAAGPTTVFTATLYDSETSTTQGTWTLTTSETTSDCDAEKTLTDFTGPGSGLPATITATPQHIHLCTEFCGLDCYLAEEYALSFTGFEADPDDHASHPCDDPATHPGQPYTHAQMRCIRCEDLNVDGFAYRSEAGGTYRDACDDVDGTVVTYFTDLIFICHFVNPFGFGGGGWNCAIQSESDKYIECRLCIVCDFDPSEYITLAVTLAMGPDPGIEYSLDVLKTEFDCEATYELPCTNPEMCPDSTTLVCTITPQL